MNLLPWRALACLIFPITRHPYWQFWDPSSRNPWYALGHWVSMNPPHLLRLWDRRLLSPRGEYFWVWSSETRARGTCCEILMHSVGPPGLPLPHLQLGAYPHSPWICPLAHSSSQASLLARARAYLEEAWPGSSPSSAPFSLLLAFQGTYWSILRSPSSWWLPSSPASALDWMSWFAFRRS